MSTNELSYRLPPSIAPSSPIGAFKLPTRLRTALTRKLPVTNAAELAALPVERLGHISGLGKRTRPVLTEVVLHTRHLLGGGRYMAPRLAGDTPLDDQPLAELAGELPRAERIALGSIGIRTVAALGEMPRAVLARIEGLGPDALGRLTALCLRDRALNSLTGIKAALAPMRRDAIELCYGLRDGRVRSPREVAMILGRRVTQVDHLVDPESLLTQPPMRVLAAAVKEAIAPVGFGVLSVVAGRIARRLPPGPDDRVDAKAFARMGALLIRPGARPEDARDLHVVAEPRWTPALLDELSEVLRAAHQLRLDERRMADRLSTAARAAGVRGVPPDALLVAVAGLCPGVVLSLSPPAVSPPAITDPEIQAIVGAPPEALVSGPPPAMAPVVITPEPTPRSVFDAAEPVRNAVADNALRAHAGDASTDGLPLAALKTAVEQGGARAIRIPRGDAVDGLAAALSAEVGADAVTVVEIGRALTAGLKAMTDADRLRPAERRSRLSVALDRVVDQCAGEGRVTILAELSLALTLGMQSWLAALLERRSKAVEGLLLIAAPGVVDDDGLLIDRLHRLPVLEPRHVLN